MSTSTPAPVKQNSPGLPQQTMNRNIYDNCYGTQRSHSNGSIFDYYTDNSMYINKNKCNDFTPPFISYIPVGINSRDVNLESDLIGITRNNSRCANSKYVPLDNNLAERIDTTIIDKTASCNNEFKILPNAYINGMSYTNKKQY